MSVAGLTITVGSRVYLVGVQTNTPGHCSNGTEVYLHVEKFNKFLVKVMNKTYGEYPCTPLVPYPFAESLKKDSTKMEDDKIVRSMLGYLKAKKAEYGKANKAVRDRYGMS